jgi:DNA-directed RNA polymerase subunit RPC12/RpoP
MASWLAGPLILAAVLGAFVLLRRGPETLFSGVLIAICGAAVLWLLVSILSPAKPDRKCPECGNLALERMSEDALHGLRCTRCGFEDEQASAWKFAEEGERALEPFVLQNRRGDGPAANSREPGAPA